MNPERPTACSSARPSNATCVARFAGSNASAARAYFKPKCVSASPFDTVLATGAFEPASHVQMTTESPGNLTW